MLIGTLERRIIEMIKRNRKIKVVINDLELEITDKVFAHDVALAYQGFLIREKSKLIRKNENN